MINEILKFYQRKPFGMGCDITTQKLKFTPQCIIIKTYGTSTL